MPEYNTQNNPHGPNYISPDNRVLLTTETPISSSQGVNSQDDIIIPNIASKNLDRTFGRNEDYIELHVYNHNNNLLSSNYNFKDYIN